MDEPAKNSIWNYLIPLWQLEQVSSIFWRRGVEVSLTSHFSFLEPSTQTVKIDFVRLSDYNKEVRICMNILLKR